MARESRSELDLGRNWPLVMFSQQQARAAELPVPKSLARRPARPRAAPLRLLSQTVQFYLDLLPKRRTHRQTLAAPNPLSPDTLVDIVARNATREDPTIPRPRAAALRPPPAAAATPQPYPAPPPLRPADSYPELAAIDDGALSDPELAALVAPRWPAALLLSLTAALAALAATLLVLALRSGDAADAGAPATITAAAAQPLQIEVHPPPAAPAPSALHPALREDLTFEPEPVTRTETRAAAEQPRRRGVRKRAPRPTVNAAAVDDILAAAAGG